nr:hypothetical protein [Tanacetum cinerariifolium]
TAAKAGSKPMQVRWSLQPRRQDGQNCRLCGFWSEVEVRGLDQVVAGGAGFDAALLNGEVAAACIENDAFLGGDVNFVFGAGDVQALAGQQFQMIVLRLDTHRSLVGDQFDPELAHEHAQPLADAHEEFFDDTDVGRAACVEHQVVLRGQLQMP